MRRPRQPDNEELELFRQAMSDVRPLKKQDVVFRPKRPLPRRSRDEVASEPLPDNLFSDHHGDDPPTPPDDGFFTRGGLQHKLLRRFRRGQMPIEGELDLHGQRSLEARQSLTHFLHQAQHMRCRVVRIIHGKGNRSENATPVLRARVWQWLRQHPEVLAMVQAQPRDGGSGALYVLLKLCYTK